MSIVRTALPATAVATLLLLTGCAGDENSAAAGPSASPTAATTSATPSATPSASPTPAAATTPSAPQGKNLTVTFAGGQVTGDTGRVDVATGETVNITVSSDTADEVHLHGYDVSVEVTPGTPAVLTFQATIPGVFEVELEKLGKQLLSVQVA